MVGELEAARKVAGDEPRRSSTTSGDVRGSQSAAQDRGEAHSVKGFGFHARGAVRVAPVTGKYSTGPVRAARSARGQARRNDAVGARPESRCANERAELVSSSFPREGQGSEGMMDLQEQMSFLNATSGLAGTSRRTREGPGGRRKTVKASLHLKLGRVLEGKFLQSVKALKHFQDAYKLNPALLEALEEARFIYWDLGKTTMVQKLLELELKNMQDGPARATCSSSSGTSIAIRATPRRPRRRTRARSAFRRERTPRRAGASKTCRSRSDMARSRRRSFAARTTPPTGRQALFVRAARIARRFAPEAVEGMLASGLRGRSREPRGGDALREAARRGGSAPTRFSSDSARSSRRSRCRQARAKRRFASVRAGSRAIRTWSSASSSCRRLSRRSHERSGVHLLARDLGHQRRELGARPRAARQGERRRRATAPRRSCSRKRRR